MKKEEFEALLETAYYEGYKQANLDIYNEGIINDIKTWYKRRLTSDEVKEAEKEFKSIISKIKLPKGISFKYNFIIKKGTYKVKPLQIKTNRFHILNKNGIVNFTISEISGDNTAWKMTDIIHKILDILNSKSKNFKYVVHKTINSTNYSGYTGEIFAYRKKDNIEKDMPFNKGNRINTLHKQIIITY